MIQACMSHISSSFTMTRIPSGGFDCSAYNSCEMRLITAGEIFSIDDYLGRYETNVYAVRYDINLVNKSNL